MVHKREFVVLKKKARTGFVFAQGLGIVLQISKQVTVMI
jgi:hypothetical protein